MNPAYRFRTRTVLTLALLIPIGLSGFRKKRLIRLVAILAVLALPMACGTGVTAGAGLSGESGSGSGGGAANATPAGTYTLTVTASLPGSQSGGQPLQHSVPLALVVN
jgi:hypothetical protein